MFRSLSNTRTLVTTAAFSALAFLISLIEIPSPFLPYLQLDFSEIMVILSATTLGGGPMVLVILLRSLLRFVLKGTLVFGEVAAISASLLLGITFLLLHRAFRHRSHMVTERHAERTLILTIVVFLGATVALPFFPLQANWLLAAYLTFLLPALGFALILLYRRKVFAKVSPLLLIQAIVSISVMTIGMTILNFFFITPSNALQTIAFYPELVNLWFGGSLSTYLYAAIAPLIPFNLFKGILVFLVFFLIHGRIERALHQEHR